MTDKLTTAQKAEAWVNQQRIIRSIAVNKRDPMEHIAALLKENRALLDALKTLADEEWRDDDDEILIDARTKARVAIAMCEEQNNE